MLRLAAPMGERIVETVKTQDRLEINWFNVVGASLGAVSSAVVLSTLGAAGTLLGAALGSLCITVGGAIYAHTMKLTKDRVAAAKSLAAERPVRSRERVMAGGPTVSSRPTQPASADRSPSESGTDAASSTGRLTAPLEGLPWKRIAVLAGALFAITMAVILAFELSTGRAVSTFTGGTSDTSVGTSFSGVVGSSAGEGVSDTGGEPAHDDQLPADDGRSDLGPAQDGDSDDPPAQDEQQDQAPAQDEEQDQAPAQGELPAQEGQQDDAPAQDEQQDQAPAEPAPAPAPQPDAPAPGTAPQG